MGSTRFRDPPDVELVPEVADDRLDFSELERLRADPVAASGSTSLSSDDKRVGLSQRGDFGSVDELRSTTWEMESGGGRSMVGRVGVAGAEAEDVASVDIDAARRETPDTDRSRNRVSLTTSCICRFIGFLDDVGGGRTTM
jgi:hypothetical protein